MPDCLNQLDAILSIAEDEYTALLDGDINAAERMCEERENLMRQAMSAADEAPQRALCDKLLSLQSIQQKLRDEAARQREELRGQLFQTKQEARRMNAYHQSILIASG